MKPIPRYIVFLLTLTLWSVVSFTMPDFFDNPVDGLRSVLTLGGYCVALGLATFFLLLFLTANRLVASVCLPVYAILGGMVSYYRVVYHATITPAILDATFHTNASSIASVLDIKMLLWVMLQLALSVVFIRWRWRQGHLPKAWFIALIGLIGMPAYNYSNSRLHRSINQRYPYNVAYNIVQYAHLEHLRRQPRELHPAQQIAHHPDTLDIIVVLGEAVRADHLSLNGYGRLTTPRLSVRPGIQSLGKVYSPYTHTAASLPYMLTPADSIHPEWAYTRESFIPYLSEAGFRTAWLSNQDYNATYTHFIHTADTIIFPNKEKSVFVFSRWTDADLLAPLAGLQAQNTALNLYVLHTIGAHWYYGNHVPEGFEPFSPITSSRTVTENDSIAVVNAYDNCVAYLDVFIDSVCTLFSHRPTLLIYQSDHGESLGENGCWLHAAGEEPTQWPAGFIWYSPPLAQHYPDMVSYIDSMADSPISTAYLFPLVLRAAGLEL